MPSLQSHSQMPRRKPRVWNAVKSGAESASNGVTSGAEASLHKVTLHKNIANKLTALFQCLAALMGGTDETLFGDLRVARGRRLRSATASAAGRDQPAAPAAGSPGASEVTLGRPRWSERMEIQPPCRRSDYPRQG